MFHHKTLAAALNMHNCVTLN